MRNRIPSYPRQFWVLFYGQLVSAVGMSLIWPFMTIYVREKLDVSLTTVGLVLAANSAAGLVSQVVGGPLIDRFGRKIAMATSLGARAVIMVALGLAGSLSSFAVLTVLSGFFGALFNPALSSMVADLVEPERRLEAYGLLRMIANLGIAIGPAIGGFIATQSYLVSFLAASSASAAYFFVILFLVRETRPDVAADSGEGAEIGGGYGRLLRDSPFILFCLTFALMGMAYVQMMTIFPVYLKEQYQIPESQFGLIMAANAMMVVLFQYPVTRWLKRIALGPALALGALFVAVGLATVAVSTVFSLFLLSMVIVTIGELIFMPSSTTYVADVAPEAMRGRYMGVYGMSFGLAFGLAPIAGGVINDGIGPVFIWYVMAVVALVSAVSFLIIGRQAFGQRRPGQPLIATVEVPAPGNPQPACGDDRRNPIQAPLE